MKSWVKGFAGIGVGLTASVAVFGAQGCLDRPVVPIVPASGGLSVTKLQVKHVEKVDLLLMVDNSISMSDKQSELSRRMPQLIQALTDPVQVPGQPKTVAAKDVHVGIITSSLGSHGTSACAESTAGKHANDHGHLLPRAGEGTGMGFTVTGPTTCPSPVQAAPLTWVAGGGAATGVQLQAATSCVVQSAQQDGCGYEESLESIYHFLIDPAPYQTAEVKCVLGSGGDACGNNPIVVSGVDTVLLAQREAFLRHDSLLAVIILTDEDDASLQPFDKYWVPWGFADGFMKRGWKACESVPDDFEPETADEYAKLLKDYKCNTCFIDESDPNCKVPWAKTPLNNDVDGRNNREFHQVQRFGRNFYWGRQRYVNGFTQSLVVGSDRKMGANPIFKTGYRTTDLVVVAGITGVPKNLVTEISPTKGEVAKALTSADWDKIVGPPGHPETRDPHMLVSIAPRAVIPKFAGDRAVDPVNGGDRDVEDGNDLQYACCAERSAQDNLAVDCTGSSPYLKNPLCSPGGKQTFFKAYPGLRQLRIIRDLGASGFVASICNKTYAPAIEGIVEKLQSALNTQCLKTVIEADATTGKVNCLIVESFADKSPVVQTGKTCEGIGKGYYCTPGAEPCRVKGSDYPPISPAEAALQFNLKIQVQDKKSGLAIEDKVQAIFDPASGNVYASSEKDGSQHLVCEILQLSSDNPLSNVSPAEAKSCLSDPAYGDAKPPTPGGGWCYTSDPAVVDLPGTSCLKRGAPGEVRFFGPAADRKIPQNGSEVFTLCVAGGGPAGSK
ncbi:MAG: hypothetical protein NVS3B20_14500 [Polyangiales bacterium]